MSFCSYILDASARNRIVTLCSTQSLWKCGDNTKCQLLQFTPRSLISTVLENIVKSQPKAEVVDARQSFRNSNEGIANRH
jgi:hypothetical protein